MLCPVCLGKGECPECNGTREADEFWQHWAPILRRAMNLNPTAAEIEAELDAIHTPPLSQEQVDRIMAKAWALIKQDMEKPQ